MSNLKASEIKNGMAVECSGTIRTARLERKPETLYVANTDYNRETFSLHFKGLTFGPNKAENRPFAELVKSGDKVLWNSDI